MVRRGLARSRSHAAELIGSGAVRVGGVTAPKAASMVGASDPIEFTSEPPPYVGRGGLKLAGAVAHFGLDVSGRKALDAGASTGGFTDFLLQAGVASVAAVDVGYGQLDARIPGLAAAGLLPLTAVAAHAVPVLRRQVDQPLIDGQIYAAGWDTQQAEPTANDRLGQPDGALERLQDPVGHPRMIPLCQASHEYVLDVLALSRHHRSLPARRLCGVVG